MPRIDEVIAGYRDQLGEVHATANQLKAKYEEAIREALVLEARIAGMEEARGLVEPAKGRKGHGIGASRKNRPLSGPWLKILNLVTLLDSVFDYDDLGMAARTIGHTDNRDNLRSQMSLYKGRGLVEPLENGRFMLTAEGQRLLKEAELDEEGSDTEAPEPSNSGPHGGGSGFPSASPEGSIPSGSTPSPQSAGWADDLDDDVPF